MEQLLTTLETTLQAIRKKQAEQTNHIASLNSQLQEKDNQIAALTNQLAATAKPAPEPPRVKEQLEPFKITRGGTYEHKRITSKVSAVACVELATEEEVIFADCEFENAGYAIKNHSGKTNLRVIRCRAKGLPHDGTMNDPRRFLSVNQIINLEVLNCQVEYMGFLTSQGTFYGSGSQGIKVLHNHVRNVSGLVKGGRRHANFVQLMNSSGIPNVEIAYNAVYNEYGQADVEDNINIYNARGRENSRMQIHDNLIVGAFYHPSQEKSKNYTGGGIIMDGDGSEATAPAYIDVWGNYIIATGNYGLGMAAGNNNRFYQNIVVNAATLPDGRSYNAINNMWTSGLWARLNSSRGGRMHSNIIEGNTVGVNYKAGRQDVSVAEGATFRENTFLPGPITKGTEQKYIQEWEAKYKARLG